MRKVLKLFTMVATLLPWSQQNAAAEKIQWKRIYPVAECKSYSLYYYKTKSNYFITWTEQDKSGKTVYHKPYVKVDSINDLSSITDIVADGVAAKCDIAVEPMRTPDDCLVSRPLGNEYVVLMQNAANVVAKVGDDCRDITSYMELQSKIENMDPTNPVQIKGGGNFGSWIMKIFANAEEDKLIKHFDACGGKSASNKFIENLILIEAGKSCVMPRPPGMMSWPEIRKIAQDISAKYKGFSILDLKDVQSKIEQDTFISITRVATENQIKELMPNKDAKKVMNNLQSMKNLLYARNKVINLKDYLSKVYVVDTAMEVAEMSVPLVIQENMMEKLPKTWSNSKKASFISKELVPRARRGYYECMRDANKRVTNNGLKADPQILLNHRNFLEEDFCKRNKKHCESAKKVVCSGDSSPSINLLSDTPKVSDSDFAKSCVMNGIVKTIKPLLDATIDTEIGRFLKDPEIDLSPNIAEEFKANAWVNFKSCVNTHPTTQKAYSKDAYQPIYYQELLTNSRPLRHIATEDFTQMLADCSNKVESIITKDFVEAIFISNKNVSDVYTNGTLAKFHGKEYHAEAIQYTQNQVKKTLDSCYKLQNERNSGVKDFKPTPALCTPLFEMEVAEKTIFRKLDETFREYGMGANDEPVRLMQEFKKCSRESRDNALRALYNPKVKAPIFNDDDGKEHLNKDGKFLNCVRTSLVGISRLIAAHEYKTQLTKRKKKLKNYSRLLSLSGEVEDVVSKCFAREMGKVKDWTGFKTLNDDNGMDKIEEICASEGNKYAMPRIMIKETASKLQELKEDKMLESNQEIGLIISQTGHDIAKELGIKAPKVLKGDDFLHYVFGEGIDAYKRKYPKSKPEDYLKYYEHKVTSRAVDKVHDKLVSKITSDANKRYGIDILELDSILTNSCIKDLYNNIADDLEKKPKDENSLNFEEFIEQLVDGFNYLKQMGGNAYKEQLNKISHFCSNTDKYQTLASVERSGLFDFVIKAKVHEKVYKAFISQANDDHEKELAHYRAYSNFDEIQPFIEKKYQDMKQIIRTHLSDRAKFDKAMFGPESKILGYAASHTDEATVEGSKANIELTRLVVEQLFKDRSANGFPMQFTKAQVVNGVGMDGFHQAKKKVIEKARELPLIKTTVEKYAIDALKSTWTVQTVEDIFRWEQLPAYKKSEFVNQVYTNGVIPKILEDTEQDPSRRKKLTDEVKRKKELITDFVTKHTEGWHNKGKTFEEEISDMITEKAKAKTLSFKGGTKAAGEAINRGAESASKKLKKEAKRVIDDFEYAWDHFWD